jgi:hypothetical protein
VHKEIWPVIGGRLGFVAFHGSINEPAKCAPGTAQGLQACYDAYLLDFERMYVHTWLQNRQTATAQQELGMILQASGMGMNGQPGRPPNTTMPRPDLIIMQLMHQHTHSSVQDMRAAGVKEDVIALIERYRPQLQANEQQRNMSRSGVLDQSQPQHPQPNFPGAPAQPPLGQPPAPVRDSGSAGTPAPTNELHGPAFVPGGQQPTSVMDHALQRLQQQGPPTQMQLVNASKLVTKIKQDILAKRDPTMFPLVQIPDEQRLEYNQTFEQLLRLVVTDLEPKLAWLAVVVQTNQTVQKLTFIVSSAITRPGPQFLTMACYF